MNVREKLVELIRHEVVPYFAERIADHLIANGVTVQQWIPVTERFPEDNKLVVCLIGDTDYPEYDILRWNNADYRWDNGEEWFYKDEVTHWMPMPEPPKEDSV